MDILPSSRIAELEELIGGLEKRVGRIDAKLDALLRHFKIDYDPYGGLFAEIAYALKDGDKIEAIKLYRKASGAGLKEAKDFIEEGISKGEFN